MNNEHKKTSCIIGIMTIRLKQLREADLNLLVYLFVLMEEQGISRAAKRMGLTQPSISRALKRLRILFHDELLTRTPMGYEPTQRGQELLDELAVLLPQIERFLSGRTFNPTQDRVSFRICATDNATQLYAPVLCEDILDFKLSLTFQPWSDNRFVELERNVLDLVLDAKIGEVPEHLHREILFEDEFVCLAASTSTLSDRLSMKQYLAQPHIGVNVLQGRQTVPELALAAVGKRRKCPISVPYFTVAMKLAQSGPFLATVPRRLALAYADPHKTRVLLPPPEIVGYSYMMYWHPRREHDPQHRWLRQSMKDATARIAPL
jgi:DNA-binding transcriptional LysR family regulator